MTKRLLIFSFALVFVLSITSAVFAEEAIPACIGTKISGTLVDFYDSTQTLVLNTESGLCTVTYLQDADYGHPIVTLLGNYFEVDFGSYDSDGFAAALDGTEVCVESSGGSWGLTEPQPGDLSTCPTTARVYDVNEEGKIMLLFGDGTQGTLEGTGDNYDALKSLIEGLMFFDTDLSGDGIAAGVGDAIALPATMKMALASV